MSTPTIEEIARLQAEVRNYKLREDVAAEAFHKLESERDAALALIDSLRACMEDADARMALERSRRGAAEAAFTEVQSTLRYYAEWQGSCTEGHPDDADSVKDAPAIALDKRVNKALALTPESMGSKLAELEKERDTESEAKKEYHDRVETLADIAKVPFPRSFETIKTHISRREARIAEQDAELQRLRAEIKRYSGVIVRGLLEKNGELITQRDALIAAGDAVLSGSVINWPENKAAWDAAKGKATT